VENALWRNARFMNSREIGACDHMVVEWTYPSGPHDDVLIVQENRKPRVKRRQLQVEVHSYVPSLTFN
jgi:hypothetical protein